MVLEGGKHITFLIDSPSQNFSSSIICREYMRNISDFLLLVNPSKPTIDNPVSFLDLVYKSMSEAVKKHPEADILINFASLRSAFDATMEAMSFGQVKRGRDGGGGGGGGGGGQRERDRKQGRENGGG